MNLASQTRYESYLASRPKFETQEEQVLDAITNGLVDAWSISSVTGMLITSVRRALTNLKKDGKIVESGTTYHKGTERNVTIYKVIYQQLTLY